MLIMLLGTNYAQNYAGIIGKAPILIEVKMSVMPKTEVTVMS